MDLSAGIRVWKPCFVEGVDTFVEIGPGKTLTGFLRKIDKNVKAYHIGSWEEAVQVCEELK